MSRRRICKALAACLVLATLLSAFPAMAAGTEAADSVYRNGNIYTVDEAFSKATALAIKGDRLVYVGGEAGVEAYIGPDTKVVDLGGETVIPGLVEGHMHVAGLGSSLMNLDCFWMPKQAILDLVKAAAEQAKPGEWIQGRGWMNTVWEDTSYPTKEELDAVAPNNPVFLTRACGHMGWANSKAIELAGITPDTPNPQGGEYLKNANGELLGCMTDTAMNPIRELIPELTVEQMQEGLLKAARGNAESSNRALPPDDGAVLLPVGQRVRHFVFGLGRVLDVDLNKGAHVIQFDGMGTPRSISLRAKLEKSGP